MDQPNRLGKSLIGRALREQRLATCQQRAPRVGGHLKYPGTEPCQRSLGLPGRLAGPHVRLHRVRNRDHSSQRVDLGLFRGGELQQPVGRLVRPPDSQFKQPQRSTRDGDEVRPGSSRPERGQPADVLACVRFASPDCLDARHHGQVRIPAEAKVERQPVSRFGRRVGQVESAIQEQFQRLLLERDRKEAKQPLPTRQVHRVANGSPAPWSNPADAASAAQICARTTSAGS